MKKGSKVVLGVVSVCVALCMGVSLAACSSNDEPVPPDEETPAHTHEAGSTWSYDDTSHWHLCTADDGEIMDKADHTWKTVYNNDGTDTLTCSVCGYSKTVVENSDVWDGEAPDEDQVNDWIDTGVEGEDGVVTYEISTAEELAVFAAAVNGTYTADAEEGDDEESTEGEDEVSFDATFSNAVVKLTANIDLDGIEWTTIGTATLNASGSVTGTPNPFSGTFDGQGHIISNLDIETKAEASDESEDTLVDEGYLDCDGLFGYVKDATIENFTINNVTIVEGAGVGAVVGYSESTENSGTNTLIKNCNVSGVIQLSGTHFTGGIVGCAHITVIEDCSVIGEEGSFVHGFYVGDNFEGDAVGGIAGLFGHPQTGGVVSSMSGVTVSGLDIQGSRKVGGLIGDTNVQGSGTTTATDNTATYIPLVTGEDGVYNTIENCTISIMYVDNYTAGKINGSRLYVGAVLGECTNGNVSIDYVKVTGVTISYYDAACVYGASDTETETENAGLYGGSRNSKLFSIGENVSCSVTLIKLEIPASSTEDDAEG